MAKDQIQAGCAWQQKV